MNTATPKTLKSLRPAPVKKRSVATKKQPKATPVAKRNATEPVNEANPARLGYVGIPPGKTRNSNDWYTPEKYLVAAKKVLAGFDLDPFSSPSANKLVKAKKFYTESDDAFKQSWASTSVWMNPPYSGSLVAQATGKFMDEFKAGTFPSGIFLVNNATETKWFQRALTEATAVCFTDHRISFWNADGKAISGNTRGQAFFLFGAEHLDKFKAEFTNFGRTVSLQ